MDFYLTNLRTGSRLRFPLLPDRLNVKTGANALSFMVIKTGEVKVPRGTNVTGYSWNGTFPGKNMRHMSFVFDWQEPRKIVALLQDWMSRGDTLRFMATEVGINVDVFIDTFVFDYYGTGNISYTLNLTKRIELTITTVQGTPPPPRKQPKRPTITGGGSSSSSSTGGGKSGGSSGGTSGGSRGGSPGGGGGSYRVKAGDSLYSIAKAMLGDGSRFMEIYNMNKATIDAANKGKGVSKYTLQPGIYLKLPAKRATAKANTVASVFSNTVKSVVSTVSTAVKSFVSSPPGKLIVNVAKTAFNAFKSLGSKSAVNTVPPSKKASKSAVVRNEKKFHSLK